MSIPGQPIAMNTEPRSAEAWANEAMGWLVASHPWASGAFNDVVKALHGFAAQEGAALLEANRRLSIAAVELGQDKRELQQRVEALMSVTTILLVLGRTHAAGGRDDG